jgi:hypothetical protein
VRKISPPLGFDPRIVQPVQSRYTEYATRPSKQCSLIVRKFEDIRLISSQLEQISSVIYFQCVQSIPEFSERILLKSGINLNAIHEVRGDSTVTYTFSLLSQMYTRNLSSLKIEKSLDYTRTKYHKIQISKYNYSSEKNPILNKNLCICTLLNEFNFKTCQHLIKKEQRFVCNEVLTACII